MTRYINAQKMQLDELIGYTRAQVQVDSMTARINTIVHLKLQQLIDDAPAADVVPVIHAYWIHDGGGYDGRDDFYHCSKCGRTINMICGDKLENYPYCHCGAKMDEEGD